ncbi:MAG: hypothetical protein ACIAXF_00210 [Phycisphaerales bacterium JB063]
MRNATCLTALLLSACTLLPGCIGISAQKHYTRRATLGQELTDLKTAHDQGVINDVEYAEMRANLIHGHDDD